MFSGKFLKRFEGNIYYEPSCGCWLWGAGATTLGYGETFVNGRVAYAHRICWEINRGPIPDGMFLCHRCDTPSCINPDHMFLGTQRDNLHDMAKKGRKPVGEKHKSAKYTSAQIAAIRADTRPSKVIAAEYGAHRDYITAIKRGANRRHDG